MIADMSMEWISYLEEKQMVQSIFEEMGGRYERQGEYILPCLTIPPEKEQSIDLFGRRHLDYLREYRKITYTNLLTSGRLNAYLADIDRQAQEHFERLIEGMKQAQGITECLREDGRDLLGLLSRIFMRDTADYSFDSEGYDED